MPSNTSKENKPSHPYAGRILTRNFSTALKQTVEEEIAACTAFDRLGLSIMPYVAAWHIEKPGIWYEYASPHFLSLFDVPPDRLSEVFSGAIMDHRVYKEADLYPDVKEMILPRSELELQRNRIREESIQSGETEAVYKVLLPDSRTVWLKDWAHVQTFVTDGICLSPGYLADVSMEMQQKDQVNELNVMVNKDKGLLVEAERHAALGQLSDQVYHEIRNPILAIAGLAKRLAENLSDPGHRKYMTVIVNEAARLEKILNNLFRITSQVTTQPEQTDLVQMVKSVIGLLQTELDSNNIQLSFTPDRGLPQLQIDRELIHESLVHIIKNSLEAMPEGGTLSVELTRESNSVAIKIQDTGPGISTGHERRATEPFFTTKVYGTGLGLSLAKKSAELHDGTLTIKPVDTGGTEVCMSLPLKKVRIR